MSVENAISRAVHPDRFVLSVRPQLSQQTVSHRWNHVNSILRIGMMSGLQMQLDATLQLLCDACAEITPFDLALAYFWNPKDERSLLRTISGTAPKTDLYVQLKERLHENNLVDHWCRIYRQPVRVRRNENADVDTILQVSGGESVLGIPVIVNNRVMGSLQLISKNAQAFSDEDAQLLWVLVHVAENLLTREHANESLMLFAFTDHLTGLRTRGYFEQQLELEIKRSERKNEHFALLMLDIDNFKQLNDTFGHSIGDQVLREMAAVLAQDMREVDTVARYGGEEFVMILPETTEEEGYAVAERIRHAVETTTFLSGPEMACIAPLSLSVSVGMASFPNDARNRKNLAEFSDVALYSAKAEGKNRVIRYSMMKKQTPETV